MKTTALSSWHQSRGAKMINFHGWVLPLQYREGILKEHMHVRSKSGLFDVSHMHYVQIKGCDRGKFLGRLCTANINRLDNNKSVYTLFTNTKGGIKDDAILTNLGDSLNIVFNASNADKMMAHLAENKRANQDVTIEELKWANLLALQGPKSHTVLDKYFDTSKLKFMERCNVSIDGIDCGITRCGYTGEDGFEILCDFQKAEKLANILTNCPDVEPIGLGARDSLRLEAGLCLYGNDIDEQTTPNEANIMFAVDKSKRDDINVLGMRAIIDQFKNKNHTIRKIGLLLEDRGMPHKDDKLMIDGEIIGRITSGAFSPILKKGIAMGYVDKGFTGVGREIKIINSKNREIKGVITKLPFIPHKYYNPLSDKE